MKVEENIKHFNECEWMKELWNMFVDCWRRMCEMFWL